MRINTINHLSAMLWSQADQTKSPSLAATFSPTIPHTVLNATQSGRLSLSWLAGKKKKQKKTHQHQKKNRLSIPGSTSQGEESS